MNEARRLIQLTGASGYIGGRLLKRLEKGEHRVRCLARHPEFVRPRAEEGTEVVAGDVLDPGSLDAALAGVDTAYYLVHALAEPRDFERWEREGAVNFAAACARHHVQRIVYLGGLGGDDERLSAHLRSRHETGRILAASGIPTIEFRASIILGSGSLSFEMIRALVERLPMMITPRWVSVQAQPIAIQDVLAYLVAAFDVPARGHLVFEIGGADRVSYGDLMREYARQRGLRRRLIPVPVLTPRLSSWWLGLVTPLYARVGRKLIDGLRFPTVVRDPAALAAFDARPMGVRMAIEQALRNEDEEAAATRWSDAVSSWTARSPYGGVRFGNRLADVWSFHSRAPPEAIFRVMVRIGGRRGWYSAMRCGRCAGGWIFWSAGLACAAAAAIPMPCESATRSTVGASKRSSRVGSCGCGPRCACLGAPGWNSQ